MRGGTKTEQEEEEEQQQEQQQLGEGENQRSLVCAMISSLCCLPARAVATLFLAVCMRSLTLACSFSTDDKGKEMATSDGKTAGLIAKEDDRSILHAAKAGGGNVENQLQTSEGSKENQLAVKEKERYFFISQETYDRYTEPLPQVLSSSSPLL